jgi:hypothetical protein
MQDASSSVIITTTAWLYACDKRIGYYVKLHRVKEVTVNKIPNIVFSTESGMEPSSGSFLTDRRGRVEKTEGICDRQI